MIDDKVRKAHDELERAESRRVSLFTVLAILVVLVGSFALLKSYGVVGRAISVPDNLKCAAVPGGATGVLSTNVLGFTIGEEATLQEPQKTFCAVGSDAVSLLGKPLNTLLLGDSCVAQNDNDLVQFTSQGKVTAFPRACVDDNFVVVEQSNLLAYGTCEGNNARIITVDCACGQGLCAQPGAPVFVGDGGVGGGVVPAGNVDPPFPLDGVVKPGAPVPAVVGGAEGDNCDNIPCREGLRCLSHICQTQTCSDTEGAFGVKDVTIPGTITIKRSVSKNDLVHKDECSPNNPNIISEYFCEDASHTGYETVSCPQGTTCQLIEGVAVCQGAPAVGVVQPGGGIVAPPACVDTDGSNFGQKGEVSMGVLRLPDFCNGNDLIEATCVNNDIVDVRVPCAGGCTDGVCTQPGQPVPLPAVQPRPAPAARGGGFGGAVDAAQRAAQQVQQIAQQAAQAPAAQPAVPAAPAAPAAPAQPAAQAPQALGCVDNDSPGDRVDVARQALTKSKVTLNSEEYFDVCGSDRQTMNMVQERVCAAGQVSVTSYDCAPAGRVCRDGKCVDSAPEKALNGLCTEAGLPNVAWDNVCNANLVCFQAYLDDPRGICVAKRGLNEYCVQPAHCESNNCVNRKCAAAGVVAPQDVGAACRADAECKTNACINGRCSNQNPNGRPCQSNNHCASGNCQNNVCAMRAQPAAQPAAPAQPAVPVAPAAAPAPPVAGCVDISCPQGKICRLPVTGSRDDSPAQRNFDVSKPQVCANPMDAGFPCSVSKHCKQGLQCMNGRCAADAAQAAAAARGGFGGAVRRAAAVARQQAASPAPAAAAPAQPAQLAPGARAPVVQAAVPAPPVAGCVDVSCERGKICRLPVTGSRDDPPTSRNFDKSKAQVCANPMDAGFPCSVSKHCKQGLKCMNGRCAAA